MVDLAMKFDGLLQHAIDENDNVLFQLLMVYTRHPKDWGEFLTDVVLTQSAVNKALRESLLDAARKQSPPAIYVTNDLFAADGAWPTEYK